MNNKTALAFDVGNSESAPGAIGSDRHTLLVSSESTPAFDEPISQNLPVVLVSSHLIYFCLIGSPNNANPFQLEPWNLNHTVLH